MKKLVMILVVLGLVNVASADAIRGIDMDFVTIGNAGNAADTVVMNDGTTGYGAVGYNYRIGKYEITATQWQTINTAAGIDGTGSWSGNQPSASISWYSAARFCNYLTTGNTEDGVYKFTDGSLTNIIDHELAGSTYGMAYFLPTENEWYKAAYYTGSGYSTYANGTNTAPIAGVQSNYNGTIGAPWNVGTGTPEQNGTFDMMGNVWEWNESLIGNGPNRGIRAGSYGIYGFPGDYLSSSNRFLYSPPFYEGPDVGFRVASVPEPATICLLGLGGLGLLRRKRSKA